MAEVRRKGWHPDPYGIHNERFFFADDQPGRLVRDDGRHQFYDEIPPEAVPVSRSVRSAFSDEFPATAAQPVALASDAHGTETFERTPDLLPVVPVVPAVQAIPTEAVAPVPAWTPVSNHEGLGADGSYDGWTADSRRFDLSGRKTWYIIGAVAAVVVVVLALVVVLPSHGHPSGGSTSSVSSVQAAAAQALPTTGAAIPVVANPTAWQATHTFATGAFGLNAITCPTTNVCMAVGQTTHDVGIVLRTADGGSTWTALPLPPGVTNLDGAACANVTSCVVVGGSNALLTTDGGASWIVHSFGAGTMRAVACPAATVCVATGTVVPAHGLCTTGYSYTTADGGMTWSTTSLGCIEPSGIACPTTSCEIAGATTNGASPVGEILGSINTGTSWQSQYRASAQGTQLSAVSCPGAGVCMATGGAGLRSVLRTVNGGASWSLQPLPASLQTRPFLAVACVSSAACLTVGDTQSAATSTGGAMWDALTVPASVGTMTGVACPAANQCVATAKGTHGGGATLVLS